MNWNTSSVMSEFLKIANDTDLLGIKKTASAEKNPYPEDPKTIEEKRLKSPEKHIMEIAHPEPAFIAESRGEGGLVENEIEQQQKAIEILNKMPTGSHVGRYAVATENLVKLANECDALGQTEAANIITDAAENLLSTLKSESFF